MRRPFTGPAEPRGVIRHRLGDARRIARVVPRHRAEHERRVLGRLREHARLVEARCEGDHPVARDAPVGRLEAGESREGARLADRAAGVGAGRDRRDARGDRGRGAARGAARHHRRVPRVLHRAVEARLVRRAHRELVHVGLAEQHHAGGVEPLDDRRVVGRDEVREHARAAARQDPAGAEDVLVRERHAGERPALAARDARIRAAARPPARARPSRSRTR